MKTILLILMMTISLLADGQYFRRYYNLDFVVPKYRDEYFNSGIRTRVNYGGGLPANYYFTGIGVSINNIALPAPDNIADRMRFVRNNKAGAMVLNNLGYEFRDNPVGSPILNANGTSIAEINNGAGTGGYIAVGAVSDNSITGATVPGGSDALYTSLSSTGAVVNARRVDFTKGKDIAWCVRSSAFMPGTWVMCGQTTHTTTSGTAYTDCFVARLDVLGNVLWCFTYNFDPTPVGGLSAHCIAKQLCEDPATGNIYVVGNITDIVPAPNTDGLAFALTSGGALFGAASYDAGKIDQFEAVRFTIDGNLIVGGWSNFAPAGTAFGSNMLIVKLTPGGAILFQNLLRATDPAGANKYDCKAYDIIERINTAGLQEYYLVGPWYDGFGGVAELMYKTNGAGFGINNYIYDKMKYDFGFGIDDADNTFAKPGPVVYASVTDPGGSGFSHSHIVRTYYNGATCMNYCPANPPVDIPIALAIKTLQPFITQTCKVVKLKGKTFNYQSKLQCNQNNIACGSNLKVSTDAALTNSMSDEISIYPNPATSILNLSIYSAQSEQYTIDVSGIDGKAIIHTAKYITEGKNNIELNIADLPAGVYMISIRHGATVTHRSFIKE